MKRALTVILLAVVLLLAAACGRTNDANNVPADGFRANLELGKSAQYRTSCKSDASKTTVGTLTITEVKHYKKGDDLPDARFEAVDGYEWIEVRAETVFGDENALKYGIDRMSLVSDQYDPKLFETGLKTQEEFTSFAVRPGSSGIVADKCLFLKVLDNQGWTGDTKSVCNYIWYFRVPEKYDGMVIVFMNSGTKWPEGKYIHEVLDSDALVYRVKD